MLPFKDLNQSNKINLKRYPFNFKKHVYLKTLNFHDFSIYNNKYFVKNLIDKLNVGVLLTTSDFIVKNCNYNLEHLLDISKYFIINKNIFNVFPFLNNFINILDYKQYIKGRNISSICPKVFNMKFPSVYHKLQLSSKKNIHIEISFYPIICNNQVYNLFLFKDISYLDVYLNIFKKYKKQQVLINKIKHNDNLKTDFFTNITHELKTPINVIISAIQLLNMNFQNEIELSNDKVKNYYKCIKQNSLRLIKITNDLIDITKIESGYLKLNYENHNIINIVEDITLSVASYIENKNITLIFDTDIEEKIIACDVDKIERIILNLISNSVKFTDPGGTITVKIHDKQSAVKITVSDTGIGIPKNKLYTIFNRFAQVEESQEKNKFGSGIGLALVKHLVEMHNGIIDIKSDLGKGTSVSICLPINQEENYSGILNTKNLNQDLLEKIKVEFSNIQGTDL